MRILDAFQRIRIPHDEFLKRQLCGIASGAVMGIATSKSLEGALMGASAGNLVNPSSKMKTALVSAIFSSTILGTDWLQKIGAINFDRVFETPLAQIFSQHSLSILTGLVISFALVRTKAPKYLFPAAVALSTSHVSKLALLGFVGLRNFGRYHSYNSGMIIRSLDHPFRFPRRPIHRHSSALVNLCNFFIPLSAGIVATHAIAQQNWVLRTWTTLFFAPVLNHFPIRTISSLAFSGWCLRTGLTERQALINAVHWVAQPHILKNIGIGCSSLVLFANSRAIGFEGSFLFKNGIASLPSRCKYLMTGMGIYVLSQMSISYLYSGNVRSSNGLYYYYTAISCLGIVCGIFGNRARENDLALLRRERERLRRFPEGVRPERRGLELEHDHPPFVRALRHDEALRRPHERIRFPEGVRPERRGLELEHDHPPFVRALRHDEALRRPHERIRFPERRMLVALDSDSAPNSPSSSAASSGPLVPQHLHDDEVLSKYICPINGEPILHPVLDPTNGTTIYERSAIMRALRERRFSPTTRQPLSSFALIHLPALERFIESRIKDQSTINEELHAAAQEELARHKEAFRLKSSSESNTAAAAAAAEAPSE